MKKIEALKKLVDDLSEDAEKFYSKGNAAAGTRLRKSMQDIKVLTSEIRKEIQDSKNSAKGK